MKKLSKATLSATSIVAFLKAWYEANRTASDKKPDFYCGITKDPDTRKTQHESQDHGDKIIEKIVAIECKDVETAINVETNMGQQGFDIGDPRHEGNGAVDDSKYVYLYRKPKDSK